MCFLRFACTNTGPSVSRLCSGRGMHQDRTCITVDTVYFYSREKLADLPDVVATFVPILEIL